MDRCGVCGYRVASYRCRRCGKPICKVCLDGHGLCKPCSRCLVRVGRDAL